MCNISCILIWSAINGEILMSLLSLLALKMLDWRQFFKSSFPFPSQVVIVTGNQVICNLERYFQNAHEFRPERWLRGTKDYKKVHPFLTLPFGYGPRACIGRRLAEQNLLVLLLRVCPISISLYTSHCYEVFQFSSAVHNMPKADKKKKYVW